MSGIRVSRRQFVLAGAAATAGGIILGSHGGIAASAADAPSNRLAFATAGKGYHFDTGALRGALRRSGNSAGLYPTQDVVSGAAVAGPYSLFAPYRLLIPNTRFLPDARDWTSPSALRSDGAVEAHWLPDDKHPLELKAVYRFTAPNVVDFAATVKPQRELPKFELFLASYFEGFPASFVYVQNGGKAEEKPSFLEATKRGGDWQMFPRDDAAERMIADGRWNRPPNPVAWTIMPRLAAPLALRRDAQHGLTAVIMAPMGDCFAVSTPYGEDNHRSLYLSLFGRDLKAGEAATARARLVIGKTISDKQAVELYETYRKERQ
jgi:hypothetical protein